MRDRLGAIAASLVVTALVTGCLGPTTSLGPSGAATPPTGGSTSVPATPSPSVSSTPASPDLTGLTVIRHGLTSGGEGTWTIEVMAADGSLRPITHDAEHVAGLFWSLDGSRLFFDWYREGPDPYHGKLSSIQPDGGGRQDLVPTEPIYDPPAISPDGRWVAFGGDGGEPGPGNSGTGVEVLDLMTGAARQITQLGGTKPIWSPDSSRLLTFLPSRRLIVFDRSGHILRSVDDPQIQDVLGWTADGTGIVWPGCDISRKPVVCDRDWVADVASGTVAEYTGPTPVADPAVPSPDGRWLAATAQPALTSEPGIFVRPVAGGDAVKVSGDLAVAGWPTWSPDGMWLAFSADDPSTGVGTIYVVARTGGPLFVADPGFDDWWPAWRP